MFEQNLAGLGVLLLCNISKANLKASNASGAFVAFIFLILFSCHHGLAPERYSKLLATSTSLYSNF